MIYGDAEDPEIWERVDLDRIEVVILSVPDFEARVSAVEGLRKRGFTGVIGTISMYPEEGGTVAGGRGRLDPAPPERGWVRACRAEPRTASSG